MIIDTQRNNQGIQTFDFSLANSNALPGQSDLFKHSNGKLYYFWAENYPVGGVNERRLYISWSSDNGTTWSAKQLLTSGAWDDMPCAVQIDQTSTSSDIGIVHTRALSVKGNAGNDQYGYISRFTIDVSGNLTSAIDKVTGNIANPFDLNVHRVSSKFMITYLPSNYQGSVYVLEQTITPGNDHQGFTNNAWTSRSISGITGDSNKPPMTLRVRQLSNGHFAVLFAMHTGINGSTGVGQGTFRSDIGLCFSSDNLVTFGSVQQLSSYSDYVGFTLTDTLSALAADLTELIDGSLAIGYTEGSPYQILNTATTPALTGLSQITCLAYHAGHNMLILGNATSGLTGLWVVDLTAKTVKALNTSSTPRLWNSNVQRVAISADSKYLAVASQGALDVFDTTNADPATWTVQSFRHSTLSGILVDNIGWLAFDGNSKLYFAYATSSGVSGVWGGMLDMSAPTSVTNLSSVYGTMTLPATAQVIMEATRLVVSVSNGIFVTLKTGAASYSGTFALTGGPLAYDVVNNEYLAVKDTGDIARVRDSGSAFAIYDTVTGLSVSPQHFGTIPGVGVYWNTPGYATIPTPNWYSFALRTYMGCLQTGAVPQENNILTYSTDTWVYVKSDWVVAAYSYLGVMNVVGFPCDRNGRLRWGVFTYNPSTRQVDTSANFYDAEKIEKLGTLAYSTSTFKMVAMAFDRLVFAGRIRRLDNAPRQWGSYIAFIEPDAQKLYMRSRISRVTAQSFTARSRIRKTVTRGLDSRIRIIFAQCLKMRIRIVPETLQGIQMRLCVRSWKSSQLTNTFNISTTSNTVKLRLLFNIDNGYNRTQGLTMGCYIAPCKTTRITGRFLISGPATSSQMAWSVMGSKRLALQMRMRVSK